MFNFTTHIQDTPKQDYAQALADNMAATQTLVTKLAQLGGEPQFQLEAFQESQKATTEVRYALPVKCLVLQSTIDYSVLPFDHKWKSSVPNCKSQRVRRNNTI